MTNRWRSWQGTDDVTLEGKSGEFHARVERDIEGLYAFDVKNEDGEIIITGWRVRTEKEAKRLAESALRAVENEMSGQ